MIEISSILWDVGGVLLTNGWDHLERAAVLEQFGLESAPFEHRHEIANDPWEKGFMTADQYLAQTVFYEPRSFTPAAFLQAMKDRSLLLPNGAIRILQDLAASEEMELAMLNNEARELNDFRIERFELGRYFDVFFSSCYLGLRKPDRKFFELALDVLQRDPEEVAFIDDRAGNCDAAAALGIHAICYQDEAHCVQALEQLGLDIGVRTRT
ncbi:MAG TPA: HAD family phosphatase [Acidobacteriaceae bacterium]|nr:HAD family phosphatase [Acidobacteriaceae bacterium]